MTETKPQPQMALWTCRDGRKIRVCDMEDRHLLNTIAMVERCYSRKMLAWSLSADSYAIDAPDGAADAASHAAEEFMEKYENPDPEDIASEYPIYAALITDKERRGL